MALGVDQSTFKEVNEQWMVSCSLAGQIAGAEKEKGELEIQLNSATQIVTWTSATLKLDVANVE